jgi:hypothetical protein
MHAGESVRSDLWPRIALCLVPSVHRRTSCPVVCGASACPALAHHFEHLALIGHTEGRRFQAGRPVGRSNLKSPSSVFCRCLGIDAGRWVRPRRRQARLDRSSMPQLTAKGPAECIDQCSTQGERRSILGATTQRRAAPGRHQAVCKAPLSRAGCGRGEGRRRRRDDRLDQAEGRRR